MIGAEPNSGWLFGTLALDRKGFVLTGTAAAFENTPYATSVPGIYAVGDVRSTSVKRVASAVGEGSVVISDVHRYLATRDEIATRLSAIETLSTPRGLTPPPPKRTQSVSRACVLKPPHTPRPSPSPSSPPTSRPSSPQPPGALPPSSPSLHASASPPARMRSRRQAVSPPANRPRSEPTHTPP